MFDVTLGGAFFAGLLSFLSPCILPIVPFYLCYMAGLSMSEMTADGGIDRRTRTQMLLTSIAFSVGIMTVFVGMGATATVFGQQLREWFDILRYAAAAVILIMGLHFLGLLRIPLLNREARLETARAPSTIIGAFLVGLAFAFGWTPCVGPVLAAILFTAGAQETAADGARLLYAYAAGMTLPFILAAFFVGPFLRLMGRLRRYMGVIEKTMGVLLILFAVLIGTNSVNIIADWMLQIAPNIGTLQ